MRIVILGAGPAGISLAARLRSLQDQSGIQPELSMVSSETDPPYSPPAMAEYFLTGRDQALFWKGADVCRRLNIEFHGGRTAVCVNPAARRVLFDGGWQLDYDRLVIATGSRLYAPLDAADLPGIYNFKSLGAARDLVRHVRRGEVASALVVGAGFIGVEVALLLADLGLAVTLVEQQGQVMPAMLDAESAALVADAIARRGVSLRLGTRAEGFAGTARAEGLRLENGTTLKADAYVAATGVKPNVDFLADSGLGLGWGVQVDDRLRTSDPLIWAAGDVAETRDLFTGQRAVHAIFPNAVAQGQVVADQLLGFSTEYAGAETMNSLRHLGLPLIAAGRHQGDGELCLRRDGALRKITVGNGRIVGYRLVGDIRGAGILRSLMLRGTAIAGIERALMSPRLEFAGLNPALFSRAA